VKYDLRNIVSQIVWLICGIVCLLAASIVQYIVYDCQAQIQGTGNWSDFCM